jgi:ABC-type sugar transport system substrate-binding protein
VRNYGTPNPRHLALLGLIAVMVAVVVAGCGGGGSSSGESSTGSESSSGEPSASSEGSKPAADEETNSVLASATFLGEGETGLGIRPEEGEAKEKAEAAGTKAAKENPKGEVGPKKIGIISFLNGIESSDREVDSTTFAAAQLGWETVVCDGKGTPTQFIACGNSLLAEGVDAIVDIAIEPGLIAPVLQKANAKGVPVVEAGGGHAVGGLDGSFSTDETILGSMLGEALVEELEKVEGTPEIAIHNFPSDWGEERTAQVEKALEADPDIKVADNVQTDSTNLVGFTRSTVTTELTQNSNLSAFYFAFDSAGQVGGQVVASKYPGKKFPERPLVATFHGDLATIALMHQGAVNLIADTDYEVTCWVSIDQLAQFFGHGTEISKEPNPKYPVIGEPYTYQIVNEENLPEEGEYPTPEWDIPTYFASKWKAEFGV